MAPNNNNNETKRAGNDSGKERNQRLPFAFEVGPVTTVGELLAAKPGDTAMETKETMANPTMDELMSFLEGQFEKDGGGKAAKEIAEGDARSGKKGE